MADVTRLHIPTTCPDCNRRWLSGAIEITSADPSGDPVQVVVPKGSITLIRSRDKTTEFWCGDVMVGWKTHNYSVSQAHQDFPGMILIRKGAIARPDAISGTLVRKSSSNSPITINVGGVPERVSGRQLASFRRALRGTPPGTLGTILGH